MLQERQVLPLDKHNSLTPLHLYLSVALNSHIPCLKVVNRSHWCARTHAFLCSSLILVVTIDIVVSMIR